GLTGIYELAKDLAPALPSFATDIFLVGQVLDVCRLVVGGDAQVDDRSGWLHGCFGCSSLHLLPFFPVILSFAQRALAATDATRDRSWGVIFFIRALPDFRPRLVKYSCRMSRLFMEYRLYAERLRIARLNLARKDFAVPAAVSGTYLRRLSP